MTHRVGFRTGTLCAVALLATGSGNGLAGGTAAAELITADEASLPALPRMISRGGITRGPTIKFLSPLPDGRVKSPFDLKVDFRAHGGSRVDPSSVKVTYLREPLVDLTPRLAAGIGEAGIRQAGVSVPPGTHDLEVEVTDVDGRTRSDTVTFTVAE